MARSVSKKQIESWLEAALVPVEPSPRFSRRLRARLVQVQGEGLLTGWMAAMLLATLFLMTATWLGFALRAVFGLLAFLGLVERNRGRGGHLAVAGERIASKRGASRAH